MKERGRLRRAVEHFDQLGIVLVLVVLVVVVSFMNSTLDSANNIINALCSIYFVLLIGIAVTFVLITGGLYLSGGRVMAMSGILSAMAVRAA